MNEKEKDLCDCGGEFKYTTADKQKILNDYCGKPKQHKKRRFQKKFQKQWEIKSLPFRMCMPLLGVSYVCNKCGTKEGMYQHLGRKMIIVKPMEEPVGMVFALSNSYKDE